MRPDSAFLSASIPRWMSRSLARHSPATVESLITPAPACTASKSPFEDAGKPASITSTRMRSSCRAMRSFSSLVIEAPGLCSPSRMVVSNMISRSFMLLLRIECLKIVPRRPHAPRPGTAELGLGLCAREAQQQTRQKQAAEGEAESDGAEMHAEQYNGFPGLLQPRGIPRAAFLPQPIHVPGQPVCDKQQEEDDGRVRGYQDEAEDDQQDHEERDRTPQVDVLEAVERDVAHHRQPGVKGQERSDPRYAVVVDGNLVVARKPQESGHQRRCRWARQTLEEALVDHFDVGVEAGKPQGRPGAVNERRNPAEAPQVLERPL